MKLFKSLLLASAILLTSLILAHCFLVSYSRADEQFFVDGGLGIFNTAGDTLPQVKFMKMGMQEDLWGPLKQRFVGGAWADSSGGGRMSGGFTGYQFAFEVTNSVLQASIASGPVLISTPDTSLGGVFQLNESIFLGVADKSHDSIGIVYNHFSSAGIEMPNLGKDYLGLEVKFPISF